MEGCYFSEKARDLRDGDHPVSLQACYMKSPDFSTKV